MENLRPFFLKIFPLLSSFRAQMLKKYKENMKEYGGSAKYEENVKEYEGNMKDEET